MVDSSSLSKSKLGKSVLENAGLTSKGEKTNSDRYIAIRLTREFDSVLYKLGIGFDESVCRN